MLLKNLANDTEENVESGLKIEVKTANEMNLLPDGEYHLKTGLVFSDIDNDCAFSIKLTDALYGYGMRVSSMQVEDGKEIVIVLTSAEGLTFLLDKDTHICDLRIGMGVIQ